MSAEMIEIIIGRAVTDLEFRDVLFRNPDEALAGYDLTDDEIAAFKTYDIGLFESISGELEERISRAGLGMRSFLGSPQDLQLPSLNLGKFTPMIVSPTDK